MAEQITFDVDAFVARQLEAWPLAQANFSALAVVERRQFCMGGYSVAVQFNPARIASTGAKVDKAAVAQRKCFLCAADRPAEQIAHVWGDFDILVNPYPIFSKHLTIALRRHQRQQLMPYVGDMMSLAALMPDMAIFFNGACCGASAPDHMHFQAGEREAWPLFADFGEKENYVVWSAFGGQITTVDGIGRRVYRIEACNVQAAQALIQRVLSALRLTDEMVNAMAVSTHGGVHIYIVPRRAFRPWQYSAEADSQLLVSPASVEVGGVFITPREEHFRRISPPDIADILQQVCFADGETDTIFQQD